MTHKLLNRQLKKAARNTPDGSIDWDVFCSLVDASYNDFDKERRISNRSQEIMEEEINQLMLTDVLTQLPNRRAFEKRMEKAAANRRRGENSIVFAIGDIDKFKSINDSFGHAVGDDVLAKVAKTLQESTRDSDFLARWGGEEFALLCPMPRKDILPFFKRLGSDIRNLTIESINRPVTISFGVTILDPNRAQEEIFIAADRALYEAKNQGRDRAILDEAC